MGERYAQWVAHDVQTANQARARSFAVRRRRNVLDQWSIDRIMSRMVLVVDDDEGVRAVMATVLEDEGWTVETAENGQSALETLRWARPEAIILDLRMPVMDGLAFAERYRQFPEPRAPLILISATVNESAVRSTGAVTGLRKPIDLNVLLDTLETYAADRAAG
jgi:CheY-like chemotaxis protein